MESRSKSTDFDIRHRFRCKSSLRLLGPLMVLACPTARSRDARSARHAGKSERNFEEWKRGLFVECELARGPDVAKSE
jgi:hypothetical protein